MKGLFPKPDYQVNDLIRVGGDDRIVAGERRIYFSHLAAERFHGGAIWFDVNASLWRYEKITPFKAAAIISQVKGMLDA